MIFERTKAEIDIENVKLCMIMDMQKMKHSPISEFKNGKIEAYTIVLSALGIPDNDIALFITAIST